MNIEKFQSRMNDDRGKLRNWLFFFSRTLSFMIMANIEFCDVCFTTFDVSSSAGKIPKMRFEIYINKWDGSLNS